MKPHFKTLATILAAAVLGGGTPALAAVPLRWNVETSRAQPATFDVYRGETLSLAADLTSYGQPLALAGAVALYCQTNGMGDAWWIVPATVASNRIEAVLSPTNYPGEASSLNCFLGGPATSYRAAFRLRVLGAPGPAPSSVQLPVRTIDFSTVTVQNPPWIPAQNAEVSTLRVTDRLYFGQAPTQTGQGFGNPYLAYRDGSIVTESPDGRTIDLISEWNLHEYLEPYFSELEVYGKQDTIVFFDGDGQETNHKPRILVTDPSDAANDLAGIFYGGQVLGIFGELHNGGDSRRFELRWPWGWTGTIATSNMVESVVATVPSTYAATNAVASVNCSVQTVVDPANDTLPTFQVPDAVPGGVRDWIVHVVSNGPADITVAGFPATVDGGKTANFFSPIAAADLTKACTHGKITTFTFTEIYSTPVAVNFMVVRAELQLVSPSN